MASKNKKGAVESEATTGNQFEYKGKKYNVLYGAEVRSDVGFHILTAADICVSPEVQEYLVENKCSCIEEAI